MALSGLLAAAYVRESGINDAEATVKDGANFTADLAARQIETDLGELAATTTGLAATPSLGEVLNKPEDCSLTFSGIGAFPRAASISLIPKERWSVPRARSLSRKASPIGTIPGSSKLSVSPLWRIR
jgi:hypothetical protein